MPVLYFCVFLFALPLFSDPIDHAVVSVYAIDCKSKKVLMEENSSISLIPSSCLKLVTTAVALELLGQETQFKTELQYSGLFDKKQGMITGNLIIRGGGDPTLASPRLLSSWKLLIEEWASAIQDFGIKTISGSVVVDSTLWDPPRAIASWEWEDLGNYYAALPSALSFHDNLYFLSFLTQGEIGKSAPIFSIDPPLPTSLFLNEVVLASRGTGDRAYIFGSEIEPKRVIRGSVPQSDKQFFTIKGSIPDPAFLCASLLATELRARGIQILGNTELTSKEITSFYATLSPPLKEIITWTNHESVNLYAEHLIRKIGESHRGSTEAGIQIVKEFLKNKEVPLEGFNMVDGSGLSRRNMVSTKQLASLLVAMRESQHFPTFFSSLSEKEAGIRGKSGSMTLSRGYAGYCNEIAFAILINNCSDSSSAQKKIDELCDQIKMISKMTKESVSD